MTQKGNKNSCIARYWLSGTVTNSENGQQMTPGFWVKVDLLLHLPDSSGLTFFLRLSPRRSPDKILLCDCNVIKILPNPTHKNN